MLAKTHDGVKTGPVQWFHKLWLSMVVRQSADGQFAVTITPKRQSADRQFAVIVKKKEKKQVFIKDFQKYNFILLVNNYFLRSKKVPSDKSGFRMIILHFWLSMNENKVFSFKF